MTLLWPWIILLYSELCWQGNSAVITEAMDVNKSEGKSAEAVVEKSKKFGLNCDDWTTLQCLKEVMVDLMPALAVRRRFEIWPGLALISGGFSLEPPVDPNRLDTYLTKGIKYFLSSISLHVQAIDGQIGQELLKFGKTISSDQPREVAGRKKINLALGGVISGGILLAVGMATISAMAGKALLMSIMALALTLMHKGHHGGGGGGHHGGKSSYDVIHAPSSFGSDFPPRRWIDADAYFPKND